MSPRNSYLDRVVCHCLQVGEATLDALAEEAPFHSVEDVVQRSGAGDGCTACRRRLCEFVSASTSGA